jgi:hypothetical protein
VPNSKGGSLGLNRVKCLAIEFHQDSRRAIGFDHIMDGYGFTIAHTDRHTTLAVSRIHK